MRLPNRKPGKYTFTTFDPVMTQEKLLALQNKLERLRTVTRPQAIKETKQYAENGDFSENAEYQIAKSRLRGINRAIDEIQYQITHASVIQPATDTTTVHIGHTVTIEMNGKQQTFTILGPTETDPTRGIISYKSPLGAALMGHTIGDTIHIGTTGTTCTLVQIQ